MKGLAKDIGKEVEEHNSILDNMENQLSQVSTLVVSAVTNLGEMISSGLLESVLFFIYLLGFVT